MEREVEKTLLEIESAIKSNERRGNTHTQSVLEQAREIVGMCAQAARTPSDLKKILERDTARAPEPAPLGMDGMACPACGKKALPWDWFCGECGQRFWED